MRTLGDVFADRAKLDEEMHSYSNKLRELKQEEYDIYQEKGRQLVGLCFINNAGNYCKVVDVPERSTISSTPHVNPFQIPVFVIGDPKDASQVEVDEKLPFYYDEVYSKAITCVDTIGRFKEDYHEITQEEFNKAFKKTLESFKEKICQIQ